MKTVVIILLLILTIALNAFSFYFLPRTYNIFRSSFSYDFFGESKANYFLDSTKFSFVFRKNGETMILEITNESGVKLALNVSTVDEDTLNNTLFHDWTQVSVNSDSSINYLPSKSFCKYIEITVNPLPDAKTLQDNFIINNEVRYVLEPLKCIQSLPDNSLDTINDKFVTNE